MNMAQFTRLRIGAAPLVLGVALISTAVAAQESAPVAAEADDTSTIVVTGSRIATSTINAPNPIQIVSAEAIRSGGNVNVQDTLLKNPVFGTPGISRNNSNFSTTGAGVATVDLRNLGSDRTLVLVNGRRFVAGIPGSATVDLNNIPTQFIERVDVMTGGSSAVYGSDAVAGVVNIVLKRDFQGVELGGRVGIAERGDDLQRELNLTLGGNFDDNRGNVIVHAGYSRQGSVLSRNRANLGAAVDQISCIYLDTCTGDSVFEAYVPFYSSFAPQGRFFVGNPATQASNPAQQFTFDSNNNVVNGFSTAVHGFNRSHYRTIAVPTERYNLALSANYEVSSSVNVFVEGNYASTKVRTELEPFPLDSAGPNGIFPATGGRFNVENSFANPLGGVPVIARNAFIPDAIFNAATDTNGDGLRDIGFTKRLSDFGNRGSSVDRDTFRIVAGVNGSITDRWTYEAYYNYGQTRESQMSGGQVNVINFANALHSAVDVFDVNGNGSVTDFVCVDPTARAQGCAPVNVFGSGVMSKEAIDYITAPTNMTSLTKQSVAGAGVVGSLPGFAAGDIGLAFGAEYRKESAEQIFDALTNAGLNGGNKLGNTAGSFDVVEGYGEIRIPILADTPGFHALEVTAAGRISDYSTVGTVYSYNLSGIWAPIPDVRIRATYSQSTRAPNVGELFGGAGQTYPADLSDPCEGITLASTGTLATQCRANAGVVTNINTPKPVPPAPAPNPNGTFSLNQSDLQGISGFDFSNPDLNEEKSKSWTVGVAINPKSIAGLNGLQFTLDYFNIKIKDAITSIPRQFILTQCYQEANQDYCDLITRRVAVEGANSAGSLKFIDTSLANSGGLKTSGIDATLSYQTPAFGGNANFHLAYTHVLKGYSIPLPGSDRDRFAGESGASKDRATGTINWTNDDVGVTLTGTYFGRAYLDDQFIVGSLGDDDIHSKNYRIPSRFYLDGQFKFFVNKTAEVYFGANNILDTKAPPIITGLPYNTTGAETDASTYDPIGRRYYAGARLRF